MTRANVAILGTGDVFPSMEITTVSGSKLRVPEDLQGDWSVVLFYRGGW